MLRLGDGSCERVCVTLPVDVLDRVAACVDETVRVGVPVVVGVCELLAVLPWLGVTLGVGVTERMSENDCEEVAAADALWVCDWDCVCVWDAACEFVPEAVADCVWLTLAPWLPVGDVVGVAP